jgi:RNA-binding protein
MDRKNLIELRSAANQLKVTVTVGKHGITDATIDELNRHLKKDKLVKVRLLKSATHEADMNLQAQELADKTRSRLVETRGSTAVFHRG